MRTATALRILKYLERSPRRFTRALKRSEPEATRALLRELASDLGAVVRQLELAGEAPPPRDSTGNPDEWVAMPLTGRPMGEGM